MVGGYLEPLEIVWLKTPDKIHNKFTPDTPNIPDLVCATSLELALSYEHIGNWKKFCNFGETLFWMQVFGAITEREMQKYAGENGMLYH